MHFMNMNMNIQNSNNFMVFKYSHVAGTPFLNMVIWCVLRMYNDGEVEGEDSRHDQGGLDPRDKVVGEILLP